MVSLQKENEWYKMTHKDWFPVVGGGPECENCGAQGYEKYDICPVAVDEAIATAVSNREKEIAEEVEEIQTKLHNGHFEAGYKLTNKLLSILKH